MPENFEMQADFSIFVRIDNGEIIIYRTADGETRLEVRMESDSVWLTQAQIAQLFGTEVPAISKHIRNIFQSGELEHEVTVSKMEIVRQEGARRVKRRIDTYNLDMILSVGYRVNSKNATQFRIWANKVLKEYLIKGYAVNTQAKAEQLEELKKTVRLLSNVLVAKDVTKSEAVGLLRVITDYTYGLDTLDRYDYQQLEVLATTAEELFHATYENAMAALQVLRDKVRRQRVVRPREGRVVQEHDGRDLPDLRWLRPLPERRGEGGQSALPDGQEPLVQRRQQAYCGVPVPLVLGEQPHPLPSRRFAPFG